MPYVIMNACDDTGVVTMSTSVNVLAMRRVRRRSRIILLPMKPLQNKACMRFHLQSADYKLYIKLHVS